MQFSVRVVWRGHWLVAAGLVFIHWVLTLTRILNILTWTSRAISHNMLPAEEKLGNYHHKDTGGFYRRHLMSNLYISTEYTGWTGCITREWVNNLSLSHSVTVPVLRVMLLLKLISKQFKFPSQISFTADDGWWLWSRLVWPGWRGRDDWMQMVRLGSIAISVRYIWRRGERREERHRKHWLLASPARSQCFIKEKHIK